MAESSVNSKKRKFIVNKKKRRTTENLDVSNMDINELKNEVQRLNKHVFQLKILLDQAHSKEKNVTKTIYRERPFDFNKYHKRHVLLKFAYLGWNYQGYITQEDTKETVEDYIFSALIKTRLIEGRQTSNYHRCGRTDKGLLLFLKLKIHD